MDNAGDSRRSEGRGDPTPELRKLLELATKYPEIGPPVAELAFKLGFSEIGERVVKLGTEGDAPGVEFYFVTAHAARREKRWADAMRATVDAARAYVDAPAEARGEEDQSRLLHLVRLGFATLLFEVGDVRGEPWFVDALGEIFPRLEEELGSDPFFRTLVAQQAWFADRERSEAEWDRAAELGSAELTWNARGTWYKEAEKDVDGAERAYRRGLEVEPHSALLMHNLAQVLVDRAEKPETKPPQARKLLGEAEQLLRDGLREDAPKVRRHIHATRDRLYDLRRKLPKPPRQGGERGDRRDRSGNNKGGNRRGGKPSGGKPGDDRRDGANSPAVKKFLSEGKVNLGEMILAKLKEQGRD